MNHQISSRGLATIVAVVIMFYAGCTGGGIEPTWNPVPVSDTEYCGPACDHIGSTDGGLNCQEGQPIEMKPDVCSGGIPDEVNCVSCKKFCEDTQSHGVWLNPKCIINIQTCSQIDTCQEVKR